MHVLNLYLGTFFFVLKTMFLIKGNGIFIYASTNTGIDFVEQMLKTTINE